MAMVPTGPNQTLGVLLASMGYPSDVNKRNRTMDDSVMDNGDKPAYPPNAGWRDYDAQARGITKREELIARFMMSPHMPKLEDRDDRAQWAVKEADAALDAMERRDLYGRRD